VDLDLLLHEVISDLELPLTESGAIIKSSPLMVIEADASQIRQVFQNIISNCLKYRAPEGTPVIDIRGECLASGFLRMVIQDNGIGFNNQYAESIFEVFKRLHSHSQYPGTGMGLAICRKIVDRHQGKIWAEGNPGAGATFFIELPLKGQGDSE
jgi:light-regulated signal transduction histidine kinase (bacteriophytochrome)